MFCFIFWFLLSSPIISMEIQQFEMPDTTEEIEGFKRKRLKSFINYYEKEKKEGILHYNSILKSSYDEETVNRRTIDPSMLNYWYYHEIFKLEKKRRTKRVLKGNFLSDLLRNIDLIPWKIRKHIDFPTPESPRTFTARLTKSPSLRLTVPLQAYDPELGWQN